MGLFFRGLTNAERAEICHKLVELRQEVQQARQNFERCVEQRNAGGAEAWATRMLQADNASAMFETLLKDENRKLRERWRAALRNGDRRPAVEMLRQ